MKWAGWRPSHGNINYYVRFIQFQRHLSQSKFIIKNDIHGKNERKAALTYFSVFTVLREPFTFRAFIKPERQPADRWGGGFKHGPSAPHLVCVCRRKPHPALCIWGLSVRSGSRCCAFHRWETQGSSLRSSDGSHSSFSGWRHAFYRAEEKVSGSGSTMAEWPGSAEIKGEQGFSPFEIWLSPQPHSILVTIWSQNSFSKNFPEIILK